MKLREDRTAAMTVLVNRFVNSQEKVCVTEHLLLADPRQPLSGSTATFLARIISMLPTNDWIVGRLSTNPEFLRCVLAQPIRLLKTLDWPLGMRFRLQSLNSFK
jgi:hypothetical protein